MAPRKANLATEARGPQDVRARRNAMYPKLPDTADASPVSHILHAVAEVLDEGAHNTEAQGDIDGKANDSCNNVTNAHLYTIKKVDDWCSSTKEAVRVRESDAGHEGGEATTDKAAHGSNNRLSIGNSSRRALDPIVDDEESQARGRMEPESQVRRRQESESQAHRRLEPESQAHRRLEQAQRRHQQTLDEPFMTYRRSIDGRLVVSEVPYRRKKFPVPGRKVQSVLPKLRKLAKNETEKNRQRMVLFAERLIKFGRCRASFSKTGA